MKSTLARLGPYAKALVLVVAFVVAIAAEAVGVDIGLDPNDVWKALGAAVLVFFVPAPGYRAPSEVVDQRDVPTFDDGGDPDDHTL